MQSDEYHYLDNEIYGRVGWCRTLGGFDVKNAKMVLNNCCNAQNENTVQMRSGPSAYIIKFPIRAIEM